jgi:hypothetical protein
MKEEIVDRKIILGCANETRREKDEHVLGGDEVTVKRAHEMRRAEVERGEIMWWFLTFGDEAGFRGACFVAAFGMMDAINQALLLEINPGGNVAAGPVSPEMEIPEGARKRLLSKDDLVRYFGDVKIEMRRAPEGGSK